MVPDAQVSPQDCELGGFDDFATARENWQQAGELPGINPDLPIVITMYQVTGECLTSNVEAVSQPSRTALGLSYEDEGPMFEYVVGHEMGLLLGLQEDTTCTSSTSRLMCSNTAFQNATIEPEECSAARAAAQGFVQTKWGVTVMP